jgi:hypothetical protein
MSTAAHCMVARKQREKETEEGARDEVQLLLPTTFCRHHASSHTICCSHVISTWPLGAFQIQSIVSCIGPCRVHD